MEIANFNDKKIKISDFYKNKNKKIFNIDGIDVDEILVSKKVSCEKNNLFKSLLDIMITILLDHYL